MPNASYWGNYVTVPDVDQYADIAVQNGGAILAHAMDIPNVGRFSVVKDPAGAVITLFRSAQPNTQPESSKPAIGEPCWYELMTTDLDKSKAFYTAVFNWRWEKGPIATMEYWLGYRGDKMTCGMMLLPDQAKAAGVPPHWLSYIAVADLAQTNTRAVKLGGTSLMGPHEVPNMGVFSIFKGPEGGVIGHFEARQ